MEVERLLTVGLVTRDFLLVTRQKDGRSSDASGDHRRWEV